MVAITLSVKAFGFASSPEGRALGISGKLTQIEQSFFKHKIPGLAVWIHGIVAVNQDNRARHLLFEADS